LRLPPGSWDYFRGLTFEVAQGPGQWSVEQCDAGQWLVSCDDDALAAGANLAAIGSELFQFGDALPLGGGSFRLSRLFADAPAPNGPRRRMPQATSSQS
jgi:hypothetical protein